MDSPFRNEDTSQTMYKSMYSSSTCKFTWESGNKVDTICAKLMSVMELLGVEKFFIPIISCLVKSSQSSVDKALIKIQSMRGKL